MITKTVKKLWQGKYASVRDYEVDACVKAKCDMEIKYKDKSVVVPLGRLKLYKPNSKIFESKFGKPYKLVDIPFEKDVDAEL